MTEGIEPTPEAEPPTAAPPSTKRRGMLIGGIVTVVAIIVVGLVTLSGGDEPTIEEAACAEAREDGVTVAEGLAIFADALEDGADAAKLRAECGPLLDAVLNGMGDGPLKDNVEVTIGNCTSEVIRGTVTNNNSTTVDVTLRYELTSSNGLRVGDGLVFVDALGPGVKALWDDFLFDESYDKCRIYVDTVRQT